VHDRLLNELYQVMNKNVFVNNHKNVKIIYDILTIHKKIFLLNLLELLKLEQNRSQLRLCFPMMNMLDLNRLALFFSFHQNLKEYL
jgi:hypothetical protein